MGSGWGVALAAAMKGGLFIGVTVIDAPCGAGKTSWAIQEINAHPEQSFIYCTPFLDEIARVREACGKGRIVEPENFTTTKIEDFNNLLLEGRDIAVSHTTFLNANQETLDLIQRGNYILIVDEALDIIQDFNKLNFVESNVRQTVSEGDIDMILDNFARIIPPYNRVEWTAREYKGDKFAEIRRLAQMGRLYCVRGQMMVCIFPPEMFGLFRNVYSMTYLFNGSLMKPYFEMFGIDYELASVRKNEDGSYVVCKHEAISDTQFREKCGKLITHYWPDRRVPEYKGYALSKGWYGRASKKPDEVKKLRNKISHFIRKVAGAKASDGVVMWTCPSEYEDKFKGQGYTREREMTSEEKGLPKAEKEKVRKSLSCFVSSNARATNNYANRWALAYCCNMYMNSMLRGFFEDFQGDKKIIFNDDLFAVSCLIQWIFRSRIRNGESIHLYIPSQRMAELFNQWLNGKI